MNYWTTKALNLLTPDAIWSMDAEDYDKLTWLSTDIPKPTKAEVEAEVARLQAEYNKTEYQRQRSSEYPDLKEFADAYYWTQNGDNTKMDAYIVKCSTVKNKYPKSE